MNLNRQHLHNTANMLTNIMTSNSVVTPPCATSVTAC